MSNPFLMEQLNKLLGTRPARVIYESLNDTNTIIQKPIPTSIYIANCTNSNFDLVQTKAISLLIERSKGNFSVGDVISSVELIKCQDVELQLHDSSSKSVVVDQCKNVKIILKSDKFKDWIVFTNGSSNCEILVVEQCHKIPDNDGNYRFKSFYNNSFITKRCNNYGDIVESEGEEVLK